MGPCASVSGTWAVLFNNGMNHFHWCSSGDKCWLAVSGIVLWHMKQMVFSQRSAVCPVWCCLPCWQGSGLWSKEVGGMVTTRRKKTGLLCISCESCVELSNAQISTGISSWWVYILCRKLRAPCVVGRDLRWVGRLCSAQLSGVGVLIYCTCTVSPACSGWWRLQGELRLISLPLWRWNHMEAVWGGTAQVASGWWSFLAASLFSCRSVTWQN